jgi:hypothetical protein
VATDRVIRRAGEGKKYTGRVHERWRNRQIAETGEVKNKEGKTFYVRFYYIMKELLHV